ncbi:MAG TPA: zinc-binding dehydrogenase [Bryobacteraceae bacterium]|nr:zinc-binding dehydrogenase [Bryobacteraceae bacterium]
MKALMLSGPRDLKLVDAPSAPLQPGQVRMRVRKVGICGSDYSSIAGKLPFTRFPIIPGHEAMGELLEVCGESNWKPGDRVAIHPILCDRKDPLFAAGRVHHSDTTEVLGVVSRNGAYAEEVVLEDYMLRAVPEGMSDEAAAMIEPVDVAVRALRRGELRKGERVLVLGAGNIGLLVVQAARALGAGYVAVTDIVPDKLVRARDLGVDETLDVREGLQAEKIEKKYDLVIDGIGNEASVRDALTACRRGGRIVVYGVPSGDITFALRVAFSKDVSLMTSRLYDASFDEAMQLIASGAVRTTDIITHRVGLADAPELIQRILDGKEQPIKVMISA